MCTRHPPPLPLFRGGGQTRYVLYIFGGRALVFSITSLEAIRYPKNYLFHAIFKMCAGERPLFFWGKMLAIKCTHYSTSLEEFLNLKTHYFASNVYQFIFFRYSIPLDPPGSCDPLPTPPFDHPGIRLLNLVARAHYLTAPSP